MSRLSDCIASAGMPADEAAELRAFVDQAKGDVVAGAQAYLDSLMDSANDLRQQLKKSGYLFPVQRLQGADDPADDVKEPEKPEKDGDKTPLGSAGEDLEIIRGRRRKERTKAFDDVLEGESDLAKRAQTILDQTQSAATFKARPDGASNGLLVYLDRVRSTIAPFSQLLRHQTGGGPQKYRDSYNTAFVSFYINGTDGDRKIVDNKARRYVALLSEFEELTKNTKTIREAEDVLRNAFYENWDEAYAAGTQTSGSIYQQSKVFTQTLRPRPLLEDHKTMAAKWREPYRLLGGDFAGSFHELARGLADNMELNKNPGRRPSDKIENLKRGDKMRDWRNGREITPDDMVKTFGFRGMDAGEWVKSDQKYYQAAINAAYDGFMDLAHTLGIDPKNIAVANNGVRLGFLVGAEGTGWASAHYRPNTHTINVTKTRGDGTLAHEWAHALDYALRRNNGGDKNAAAANPRYLAVVADLKWALQSKYAARRAIDTFDRLLKGESHIANKKRLGPMETVDRYVRGQYWKYKGWHALARTTYFDNAASLGKYWSADVELWARWFEAGVFDALPDASPYLVSDFVSEGMVSSTSGYKGTPYPLGDERATFNGYLRDFIAALRFDADGNPTISEDYKLIKPRQESEIDELLRNMLADVQRRKMFAGQDIETDYGRNGVPHVENVAKALSVLFASPEIELKTISEARAKIEELMRMPVTSDGLKAADEAIELAVVMAGRRIYEEMAAAGADNAAIYDALVALYQRQPVLGVRTSTSVRNQAYSTPVPIAFLAAVRARIDADTVVYEPTAGQGALLITASPTNAKVNEIDPERRKSLAALGFESTGADATTHSPDGQVDVVIANPPFGTVADKDGRPKRFETSAYPTTAIDHAIAIKALESLKPEGRAVLIVGSQKHLGADPDGTKRRDLYRSEKSMAFFNYLWDNFKVSDFFTVSGDLYARQGASWPIDVIVISGRGKTSHKRPAASPPYIYETFEKLKEKISGKPGRVEPASWLSGGMDADEREPSDLGDQDPAGQDGNLTSPMEGPSGDESAGDGEPGSGSDADRRRRTGGGGRRAGGSGQGSPGDDAGGRTGGDADGAGAGDREPQSDLAGEDQGGAGPGRPGDAGNRQPAGLAGGGSRPGEDLNIDDILDQFLAQDQPDTTPAADPPGDQRLPDEPIGEPRSASEIGADIATNIAGAADDIVTGLTRLFGDPNRLGSGPVFDEDTYAKAKPYFVSAAQKVYKAWMDMKTLYLETLKYLNSVMKMSIDAMRNMRIYLQRFGQELIAGKIPGFGQKQNNETATEWQVPYKPKSRGMPVGTLVPINQVASVQAALQRVEDEVGNVDQFVADRLGYTLEEMIGEANEKNPGVLSAEQIDALALAIYNHENGKAFIIGDQTGVGKGRVVAGMMRYAQRIGLTPVFFTAEPKLYADILRDARDIKFDTIAPVMTGRGTTHKVLLDDESTFDPLSNGANDELLSYMIAKGTLPSKYNALFTTYDQTNSGQAGKWALRRKALETIAPNAFFILDESHEAGGTEAGWPDPTKPLPRSEWMRKVLKDASGVMYSSATFAKNPHVMSLYFRTGLSEAFDPIATMSAAIKDGGIPLQGVISDALAKAGQYIRRERSFDGVEYRERFIGINREVYKVASQGVSQIYRFDRDVMKRVREAMIEKLIEEGYISKDDGPDKAAEGVGFGSIMHNLIAQALLAMKAQAIVPDIIEAHKAGEKPVLAMVNTMESFLNEWIEENKVRNGGVVDGLSFNSLYNRYLHKTRVVTPRKPGGDKTERERIYITDEKIIELFGDEEGQEIIDQFNDHEHQIEAMDLGGLPISPMDYLREELQNAGVKVGEISGRGSLMERNERGQWILKNRKTGGMVKGRTVRDFNDGSLDGVMINAAGSTGWSGHASKLFKTSGQTRHMFILQADPNIDGFVQTLGRIHRTGQIRLPRYSIVVGDIPAERRPAALLRDKMRKLNANTSANDDSAFANRDAVDFINKYGDEVADEFLSSNTESAEAVDLLNRPDNIEGLMRKFTGRLLLLLPDDQEAVLSALIGEYRAYIDEKERMGENVLKVSAMDLKAETIETTEVQASKEGGTPEFSGPVIVEKVRARLLTTPYTLEDVSEIIRGHLGIGPDVAGAGGDTPKEQVWFSDAAKKHGENNLEKLRRAYTENLLPRNEALEAAQKELDARKAANDTQGKIDEAQKKVDAIAARIQELNSTYNYIKNDFLSHKIGYSVKLTLDPSQPSPEEFVGFITNIWVDKHARNILSRSVWKMQIAVADPIRHININASQLSGSRYKLEASDRKTVYSAFRDNLKRDAKEQRFIVTGNIIAGFNQFRGRITNYTTATGEQKTGILMSRKWDLGTALDKLPVKFADADQAVRFLDAVPRNALIEPSPAAPITVQRSGDSYLIKVKNKGGRAFYLDPEVTKIAGDFIKGSGKDPTWSVNVRDREKIVAILERYSDFFEFQWLTKSNKDEARKITGQEKPTTQAGGTPPGGAARARLRFTPTSAFAEKRADIEGRVRDLIGQITGKRARVTTATGRSGNIDQASLRASGFTGQDAAAADIMGSYDPVDNMIYVAMDPDAEATAVHEAWHWLKNNGAFGDDEISALKADRARLLELAGREGVEAARLDQEELEAYAFQAWFRAVEKGRMPGVLPAVRRAFVKVRNLFDRIVNLMRGNGFMTAEDVFEAAMSGKAAERASAVPYTAEERRVRAEYEGKAAPFYRVGPSTPRPDSRSARDQERINLIRQKMGMEHVPFRQRIRQVIDNVKRDGLARMRQGMFDMFDSIKSYETDKYGGLRDAAVSAYKAMRMTQNPRGVMRAVLRYGVLAYVPQGEGYGFVLDRSPEFAGGFEGIFKDIATRGEMDLFKGWMVARRANRLLAEDRENLFTQEDIDLLLDDHPADRLRRFEKAFSKWQKFNGRLLDVAKETGLLTQDQVDLMTEHGDYVPFYRLIDGDVEGPRPKPGAAGQSAGIRKLFGGESRINDPIENMVMNMTRIIDASFKNEAVQRVEEMLADSGVLERVKWKPARTAATGSELRRAMESIGVDVGSLTAEEHDRMASLWSIRPPEGRDIISIMKDGKRNYYRVHDPLLLNSLTQMNAKQSGQIMRAFQAAKGLLTRMVTVDPAFMASNAFSDTLHTFVVYEGKPIKPFVDTWKGFRRALKEDASLQAILAAGGGVTGYYDTDPADVDAQIRRLFPDNERHAILDTPMKLWEAWQRIGMATENANRIAIHDAVKRAGGTEAEAAFQAQDLLDYGMRGDWSAVQILIQTVPFLNARLQGLYRLGRSAFEKGDQDQLLKINKQLILHGMILAAASLAIMAGAWGEDWYEDLEEWDKDVYYHTKIGDQHVRLPKPFEVGAIFSTIPERLIRLGAGYDTAEVAGESLVKMMWNTFSFSPVPQFIAPVLEAQINRDSFTGRPIVPLGLDRLLPEEQFDDATSLLARVMGRSIPSFVSDPLEYAAGFNIKSPMVIDHLIGGYLGTIGMTVVQGADSLIGPMVGAPAGTRTGIDAVPIVNRLVRRFLPNYEGRQNKYATEFYDHREEIEKIVATIREIQRRGDTEGAKEMLNEKIGEIKDRGQLLAAYETVANINAQIKRIKFDENMSAAEKKKQINDLTARRNEIYKRAMTFAPATTRILRSGEASRPELGEIREAAE